jgi:hypothetical protein
VSLSPIPRVLSTFRRRKVRALLMGGQACILYGAAEFTRDIDLAVAVEPRNLDRLRSALAELRAEPIFFPALSAAVLRRGHACHFRCLAAGLHRFRVDVMSKMRGVDSFSKLWKRRVEVNLPGAGRVALLSLPDLVKAKKTQRDKDWPMIRRLIEADMARSPENPDSEKIPFWLMECRTFGLLRDLASRFPKQAGRISKRRPALRAAMQGNESRATLLLREEEDRERQRDRRYWAPLRAELERWRQSRPREA